MKILLVNKFHYLKGGSEKYYFELGKLLERNGHDVAYFSMDQKENIITGKKEYFVPHIDFNNASKTKALSIIYSKENGKLMEKAIKEFNPDIIHLNNFQRQLSSSVVLMAQKYNVPIVYTAHDLQAICPAIVMLDNENKICSDCTNHKYLNCIKKNCCKGSKLKSVLGVLEAYYYKHKKVYENMHIITPSKFLSVKLEKHGLNKKNITVIPNFLLDMGQYQLDTSNQGYYLYVGRISREKGIFDLIDAVMLNDGMKLVIAGTGPEVEILEATLKKYNITDRVEFVGKLEQEEVFKYVKNCIALVVPSGWYENCPYSLLEAIAIGKPVIGAKIGGIPELVEDGSNGALYEVGNIKELACIMEALSQDEKRYMEYCTNAKNVSGKYSEIKYYNKIMEVYNKILEG